VANPEDCRDRAYRCTQLAKSELDTRLRRALLKMASAWLDMATELERTHTLLDDEVLGLVPHRSTVTRYPPRVADRQRDAEGARDQRKRLLKLTETARTIANKIIR
jgi:hypothetical protein